VFVNYPLFIIEMDESLPYTYYGDTRMGKARTDKNGNTREQRLFYENQKLKRTISSLRKQLARIDLDRYDSVKEIIEQYYQEDRAEEGKAVLETLKKQWSCKECEDGTMEIYVFNRAGGTFYYRICSSAPICTNRTLAKPYLASNVKGIMRKINEES